MLRDPVVSSNNEAESALSDDDLDGVVGGRGTHVCVHGNSRAHGNCPGPNMGPDLGNVGNVGNGWNGGNGGNGGRVGGP